MITTKQAHGAMFLGLLLTMLNVQTTAQGVYDLYFVDFPENVTISCSEATEAFLESFEYVIYYECPWGLHTQIEIEDFNPLFCSYELVRTLTVEDECGNVASASYTITVLFNDEPQFVNPPAEIYVDNLDDFSLDDVAEWPVNSCTAVSFIFELTPFIGQCEQQALYVLIELVDECGNTNYHDLIVNEGNAGGQSYDCSGNCYNDLNGNGICDELEVLGCEYPDACNYNPQANVGDGTCVFPMNGYDCSGNCIFDLNGNGTCDFFEILGCTYPDAINYEPAATIDSGFCIFPLTINPCSGDLNGDQIINTADLALFLGVFNNACD
jgi:hypothetical protein